MNNKDYLQQLQDSMPDLVIRVDKKQLIAQLRALQDSYIEIWINSKNTKVIKLKDRYNLNQFTTRANYATSRTNKNYK